MFCAGGLSAPAIVASIVTLLGASGTTGAVAANMTALLSSYGIGALTSTMTTAGAGVASWKMLHRTDALREFSLEPLHPPRVQHLSESSAMVEWSRSSPVGTDGEGWAGEKAGGVGVYVLVAGHHCEQVDLRDLWGCRRYTESREDEGGEVGGEEDEGGDEGAWAYRSAVLEEMEGGGEEGCSGMGSWQSLPRGGGQAGWWDACVPPSCGEPLVLAWDTVELHRLYHAQKSFVRDRSVLLAAEELLKLASPVIGAAALPIAVMERAAELDCPWLVVMDRAEQAGKLLASVLLRNRHVVLPAASGKWQCPVLSSCANSVLNRKSSVAACRTAISCTLSIR